MFLSGRDHLDGEDLLVDGYVDGEGARFGRREGFGMEKLARDAAVREFAVLVAAERHGVIIGVGFQRVDILRDIERIAPHESRRGEC